MTQLHLGWHFCAMRDGVPVLRDGSKLEIGRTYEHTGELKLCESGYHDSERLIDALRYALGPYLCRTLASADKGDTDKRVSRYRVAIAGADITRELHEVATVFAYCALLAERERGREPDPRSWNAVAVKRRWVLGEATDEERSAAWSAAMAARSATESAAWAAGSAAWSAARAAESAAMAVESAAMAVGSAAKAAWSAADEILLGLLPRELREAGRARGEKP